MTGDPCSPASPGKRCCWAGATDDLAYVWVRPTKRLHVLDLDDGRTLRKMPARGRDVPILVTP